MLGLPRLVDIHKFIAYGEDRNFPDVGVDHVRIDIEDKNSIIMPGLSLPRPVDLVLFHSRVTT